MRRTLSIAVALVLTAQWASAQVSTIQPTLAFPQPALVFPQPVLASPQPMLAFPQPTLALTPADLSDPVRPCEGCPPRRLGRAFFQTTMINVFYGLGNLLRGEETAKITPKTWWKNMSHGWEWDLNDFVVNQFGHPYQGNNYYTSGRANGMSYWESSALAAFGSATWEYFGETNDASLNDFINTTLGGIALGEMFHRTAWLVRDTRATGKGRLWQEIGATALDPVGGLNRFASGDSSLVSDKPRDLIPSTLGTVGTAGVLWHKTTEGSLQDSTASPFLEVDLLYGDLKTGETRTPYDAFGVRLAFGGGRPVSEAQVRGRLIGQPVHNGGVQFSVSQGYQYNNTDAYRFGAQSVDADLGFVKQLSSRVSMWAMGWGGATILGAVDSVPPPGTPVVESGSSEEPTSRDYDYGPGSNVGGFIHFLRDNRAFLSASYELHHIHVIDGVRGNHVLQRARVDLNIPLKGALGAGVSGDYFNHRTFYQDPDVPDASSRYPQVRVFLSWSFQ